MHTLSSIIVLLAVATAAGAEVVVLQLRNGTVVAGPILKRTPDVYFIDLGYDVLTVPHDAVATHSALTGLRRFDMGTATEAAVASTTAPVPIAPSPEPRSFASVNEMIAASARSVVVVSNPRGLGAGFIISPDGRLLTNFHVVREERFNDVTLFVKQGDRTVRQKFDNVEVLASSALMDIALLKIPRKQLEGIELPTLSLALGPLPEVGSSVYAIGNPGMGSRILEHTVSQGIVSSRQRNINDIVYIQTTAAVNPGNSGGPLIDSSGRVVGLVTYKAVLQEGIAFALPVYYIAHFLANEEAYAVTKLSPNTGYRYRAPE
jgi:serine protease Do